ncbi:hypothetical protein [Streptomyces sp. UNOC14_S4]|uniref:hypothetical protein n=1 Tax=Streptomyces sp. UNOC14_S4 TaxID=2872340 RepID=UPI001E47B2D7|nr:hypothetical protein [Streptomyces sp. UNOC14_S4]MCC3772073.1 hypothetical protein [Streptomyces sp. UNOC14_S4]
MILRHGGRASDTCPRCHWARNREDEGKALHGIPELTDSERLREVVARIGENLRQDRGLTGDPAAVFLLGALEARIDGKDHFLVASSGRTADPWLRDEHLDGITHHPGEWQQVNPAVPADRTGWLTVRGEKVDLSVGVEDVGRPCPAVKLLLGLGQLRLDWESVEYVRVSEMAYVGPGAEDTDHVRTWRGRGAAGSWTAHSCDSCEARIPYLICDVPAHRIVDQGLFADRL